MSHRYYCEDIWSFEPFLGNSYPQSPHENGVYQSLIIANSSAPNVMRADRQVQQPISSHLRNLSQKERSPTYSLSHESPAYCIYCWYKSWIKQYFFSILNHNFKVSFNRFSQIYPLSHVCHSWYRDTHIKTHPEYYRVEKILRCFFKAVAQV